MNQSTSYGASAAFGSRPLHIESLSDLERLGFPGYRKAPPQIKITDEKREVDGSSISKLLTVYLRSRYDDWDHKGLGTRIRNNSAGAEAELARHIDYVSVLSQQGRLQVTSQNSHLAFPQASEICTCPLRAIPYHPSPIRR